MNMSQLLSSLLLLIAAIPVMQVNSTHEAQDKCTYLYNAAIELREDVFNNPGYNEVWPTEAIRNQIEYYLGLSFEDNDKLHEMACKITNVTSMSELASLISMEETMLKNYMEEIQYNSGSISVHMKKYKDELRLLRKWVKVTGFPDKWPLTIDDVHDTEDFLTNTQELVADYVTLYSGSDKSINEIALLLKDSTSLEDYLQGLDIAYLLEDPETLDIMLRLPRKITNRDTLVGIFIGYESLRDTLQAMVTLGLPYLQ